MIPADLGAELTRAIGQAIAAGELPGAAASVSPAGTWRPPPDRDSASYATSLPFELAELANAERRPSSRSASRTDCKVLTGSAPRSRRAAGTSP